VFEREAACLPPAKWALCDGIETVRESALSGCIKWEMRSSVGEREREMFYLTTLTIAKII
jgi:hypothetical protein